jgi:hypothetical protein
MVKKDLSSLEKKELSRVRITGLEVEKVPPHLRRSILPYDTRFDGPDSPLPGTRSDFPQRTCVHYLHHVLPKFGLKSDNAKIIELMESMRYPRIVYRKRLGDEEIIRLMLNRILKKHTTSTEMLRYLRDDKKVACEQGRCSHLYKISMERSNGAQKEIEDKSA